MPVISNQGDAAHIGAMSVRGAARVEDPWPKYPQYSAFFLSKPYLPGDPTLTISTYIQTEQLFEG